MLGFASSGLPGPKGNLETFVWLAEAGRGPARRGPGRRGGGGGRGMTGGSRSVTVFSHTRPEETADALRELVGVAGALGVDGAPGPRRDAQVRGPRRPASGVALDAPVSDDVDVCVALGGDGTILRALRRYAGTGVPVFAVNFGEVGFLATVDPRRTTCPPSSSAP